MQLCFSFVLAVFYFLSHTYRCRPPYVEHNKLPKFQWLVVISPKANKITNTCIAAVIFIHFLLSFVDL